MTKRPLLTKIRGQKGYTLLELMVAAAVGGLVFYTLMSLLGQTSNFATYFHSTAGAIEASSDAVSQLNAIMPEIVRIRRCSCSGGSSTAIASCLWAPPASSTEPNIGKDPVESYGIAAAGTEMEVFAGDFESYGGNVTSSAYPTDLRGLYTGNLGSAGIVCDTDVVAGIFTQAYAKGCKLPVSLYYTSPTLEAGAVPSKPGSLRICAGSACTAGGAGGSNTYIGKATDRGQSGTVGVTQLSCGFSNTASMLFSLNLKVKSRTTTEQNTSSTNYESWWPAVSGTNGGNSGKNYSRGTIRDLRFKYAFRNLTGRGIYQWRVQSNRNCVVDGASANARSDCCSNAASGTSAPYQCEMCTSAGGAAGTAGECCSEQISAGRCL